MDGDNRLHTRQVNADATLGRQHLSFERGPGPKGNERYPVSGACAHDSGHLGGALDKNDCIGWHGGVGRFVASVVFAHGGAGRKARAKALLQASNEIDGQFHFAAFGKIAPKKTPARRVMLDAVEGGAIVANRLSAIVTRTGDDGTTGLGDGTRVGKASLRVACMGEIDELNSHIGLLLTEELAPQVRADLVAIQHDLFDVGAELCLPGRTVLSAARVLALDERLADYNARLPRLQEFILPGGTRASALAHVCRTVCRRAERSLVMLATHESEGGGGSSGAPRAAPGGADAPIAAAGRPVSQTICQYCNRLSDLLFVLARTIHRDAMAAGPGSAAEPQWQPQGRPPGARDK
jgi:cob(I)alamin adenosyltransferase